MSELADLLEAHGEALLRRWTARIGKGLAPGGTSEPELRDHIPDFLRELVDGLRRSQAVDTSAVAQQHGRQRYGLGFSLEALVREYGLLRRLILDLAEESGRPITLSEVRVLTDFIATAVAEGVAEHGREREQAERSLVEAHVQAICEREERIRGLLESTAEGIWGLDTEGRCTFANPACVRLLGYGSAEELLGKDMHALTHHHHADGTPYPDEACRIYDAFRTCREVDVEDEVLWRKDGTSFPVRYRASPLVRGGQVAGAVVAFEDITRSKALLEREVEARQRVEVLAGKLRENEERYQRLIEAGIIGIVEWNASGALTEANDAFLQMLGYTREDLAEGRLDFRALTPPEHMAVTELAMRTLQETGVLLPFEKQYFRKDGSRVDILLSSATLDAERTRGIALVLDISERKAAEALVARQARYDRLTADVGLALTRNATRRAMLQRCAEVLVEHLDAALARVWLLDERGDTLVLEASAAMYTHLDGAHGRVPVGQFEIGRIAAEKRPHLIHPVVGDPRIGDQEWARREGLVAFAGAPLLVGDTLVGVVALFTRRALPQDMVEALKHVADSIALGLERLRTEGELKARADFEQHLVGIVSHDLRNPLNAILLGASTLAARDELDDRSLRTVSRIRSSAERATRMIRDLLDFTQARLGGRIPVRPGPVDLHALVRQVVEEAEVAHPGRHVEVQQEGEARGEWDSDRIAQVVANLVTNALKYSPEGSPVRIATRAEMDRVSISVCNQGAPIPPEKLSTIFEPLQRATADVDKTGRSVGLGLYIVRHIVDAHGGTIEVRSTEAEGTTFTVRLPRHAAGGRSAP